MSDWIGELKNTVRTIEALEKHLPLTDSEREDIRKALEVHKMKITPYYLSLIDKENPDCPIRKMAIPSSQELLVKEDDVEDPIGEKSFNPLRGFTHRYADRALIYPTFDCATYCRHCFRKRLVGHTEQVLSNEDIKNIANYIKDHNVIRDIIFSGGEPLILSDEKIDFLLSTIREINHVQIIRFHTRVLVTLPFRITQELINIFKKYKPVYVITQFNHPKEITKEAIDACSLLVDNGIPVLNQNPLLKGINDKYEILKKLYEKLIYIRVKPYYLVQTMLVQGKRHFWTEQPIGLKLIEQLRKSTSGLCVPDFITLTAGTKDRLVLTNGTGTAHEVRGRYTFA